MDDFIKRSDALKVIESANRMVSSLFEATMKLCVTMDRIAAADVVPVVRCGEWVEENTRPRSSQFYCSVCHRTAYDPQPTRSVGWVKRCRYHYCPNCGAKMDIPAEEGE